jgi:hypothetical protein
MGTKEDVNRVEEGLEKYVIWYSNGGDALLKK